MSYIKGRLCFFCSRWKREICRKSTAHVIERTFDYINEVTKTVSQHEDAYQLREKGTLKAFWVLFLWWNRKKSNDISWQKRKSTNSYYICGECGNLRYSLYIGTWDQLVNQLFSRQKLDGCGHVVIVENPEEIPQIEIPNVIGFCTVQEEEGGVEYYRRE